MTITHAAPVSPEDREMSERIAHAQIMIRSVLENPEIAGLLEDRGYDEAALRRGLDLQEDAQIAFNARQIAVATREEAEESLREEEEAVRQVYTNFRETARSVFTAEEKRAALGLDQPIPEETADLRTQAGAAYEAASQPAMAEALEPHGYSEEVLAAEIERLEALVAAEKAADSAAAAAEQATLDRDAAFRDLDEWLERFEGLAQVALRDHPDLQETLGLEA